MTPDAAREIMEAEALRALLLCWFVAQLWILPALGNALVFGVAQACGAVWRLVRRKASPCAS